MVYSGKKLKKNEIQEMQCKICRCEDVYFEGVGAVTLDVVWSSIEERDRTIVHSLDNIQKIGIEVSLAQQFPDFNSKNDNIHNKKKTISEIAPGIQMRRDGE